MKNSLSDTAVIIEQLAEAQDSMEYAIRWRDDMIKMARAQHLSFRKIGAILGYSEARIRQIAAK